VYLYQKRYLILQGAGHKTDVSYFIVGFDSISRWHDQTYLWAVVALRRAIRELTGGRAVVSKGIGHAGNPTVLRNIYQGDVAKMVSIALREVTLSRYGRRNSELEVLSKEICECLVYADESLMNGARQPALADIDKAILGFQTMLTTVEAQSSTVFKPWKAIFVGRTPPKRPTRGSPKPSRPPQTAEDPVESEFVPNIE